MKKLKLIVPAALLLSMLFYLLASRLFDRHVHPDINTHYRDVIAEYGAPDIIALRGDEFFNDNTNGKDCVKVIKYFDIDYTPSLKYPFYKRSGRRYIIFFDAEDKVLEHEIGIIFPTDRPEGKSQ